MRPNWNEVQRGDIRTQWAGMNVTMNPQGWIALSRVTYERMGSPKAFVVLFDPVNNRIGLKPAALTTRNAFPVRCLQPPRAKVIRAGRLIKDYRIDLPATVKFDDADTDQDGILLLDLRTARVIGRPRTTAAL